MSRQIIKMMPPARTSEEAKYLPSKLEIETNMTVIVKIDQEECIQCGKCYNDECPEVFKEGEDGTSEVVEAYQDGSSAQGRVPDQLFDCANNGAEACPVNVISVNKE
jgi:ferredoxin